MWCVIVRQEDKNGKIIYKYSKECDLLDGIVVYNPENNTYQVNNLSITDPGKWGDKVGLYIDACYKQGNLPEKKIIAIG